MLTENDLHQYQLKGVDHIFENTHCGLFLEMGLGKTVTTLTAINRLAYEDLCVNKVLVIAPKRVVQHTWHTEVQNWQHLKHLTCSRIIGTVKQRQKALQAKADIYLISRDNIAWLCGLYGGSKLPFDMLVIDESSSFKNHNTARFKALRMVQPSFKRVVLLTGTPSPNGLADLWSQIYLLDRGERLGKFIGTYRINFLKPAKQSASGQVYKYKVKSDEAKQAIYDAIGDICLSMQSADYLDLPPVIFNDVVVKFDKKLQTKYDEFEREQVLDLVEDDGTISAVNAAALSNKLLQFANGAVYDEEKVSHKIHDLKLDALEQIIEEANGKPVLVARSYKQDLDRMKKRLAKYKPVTTLTNDDINNWNAGKIQVLIMHPASGGHGLNLQAGGNIIAWFGQTWSLELWQQLNARLNRQGQTDTVFIHKILADKTIDLDVAKAIERKAAGQDGLMKAIKAKIRRYLNN